jgi:TRAP-type C4-dicarboxylate transport system permease large subunit
MAAAFLTVAFVSAILGGFGIPFRHLVEGGFGFINLAMALFGGAFFGHMMRISGAADRAAAGIVQWTGGRSYLVLAAVGLPIFIVGMFVGLSGVAILSAGVFAVPALRRIGYDDATIAGFMAVIGTAGMIAPPTNVPAMLLADGVNMPWTGVDRSLLLLSVPTALAALAWFTWWGATQPPAVSMEDRSKVTRGALIGWIPMVVIVLIWVVTRTWGEIFIDPVSPLILVIGALCALPMLMKGSDIQRAVANTFTGTPLLLAAVLVSVGVVVQIATLTGVRGWLIIQVMSLQYPWNLPSLLIGMPLIGGALTSMEAADIVGVPAAFSFIRQDMIINVTALSAIAALAEFVAPTAIAAALSCYVVGGGTIRSVVRRAWVPMLVLTVIAVLMLVFAPWLSGKIT